MADERQPMVRVFYRKLLRFYPKPFRERFGKSMEQTFDDLCREQQGRPSKIISLTVNLTVDTGVGIVKEHVLYQSQRNIMTSIFKNRLAAAIVGLLFFLPGAAIFFLLVFGLDPTAGPVRIFGMEAPAAPLSGYLQPPDNGPHIVGSLIVMCLILVFPAIGVLINAAVAEGNVVKAAASDLGIAAIVGTALVLPFVALQMTLGKTSYTNLPVPLFAILWLLPTTLVVIGAPIVRNVRSGKGLYANPIALVFRVAFLSLVAIFWISLLNDQMPCFIGVPNCD